MSARPIIGITMGDPAGIGPEIIVKALKDPGLFEECIPVVLGDPSILSENTAPHGISLRPISSSEEARGCPGTLELVSLSSLVRSEWGPGQPTLKGGKAMVRYIVEAVKGVQQGLFQAMVTCPINKGLMQEAGYRYEGHTQLIADLTGTRDYVMMLAGERLQVALATIHCALKEVPQLLSVEKIFRTIGITARSLMEDVGYERPRIAVAGLNPHAGESGLFGNEEATVIGPAIRRAREEGYEVQGPFPPDTIFHRAASGEFDVVIAMYHDQGLIPLKLLHFKDAVNVTLGLPIIRTSVDHGTAYEIAGMGKADPSSLMAAIRWACRMARNRTRRKTT